MKHQLILEKRSLRHLDNGVMKEQLTGIAARAIAGNRGKVWQLKNRIQVPEARINGEGFVYRTSLTFERVGRKASEDIVDRQWGIIQQMAEGAGRSKGWNIPADHETPTHESKTTTETEPTVQQKPKAFTPVKINTDAGQHFAHLYERDSQIALVMSAIQAYVNSNYEDRFHAILYGPPSCGKTEILRSVARMLGEESVLVFDATSTTKAGAERTLLETAEIPPVLIVEEIEKTDEHSLRWLLGVLDHRAELRKITHRSTKSRSVKLLCLATANDIELFRKVMEGSLASRFSHHIYSGRPSREVLKKILLREIERSKGDVAWIDPALDWCLNEEGTNDPRRIITICLCGREKLLDGSYQKHLKATMENK